MCKVIFTLAFLIASSASFAAADLPIELEHLSRRNLPFYKELLRQFAIEDQAKGIIQEYSIAHLTAHEREIDELAALGLYEIPTLFTDWLICQGEYVIGCYSINIPPYEFLIDADMLFTKGIPPVPVVVLEKFTYPAATTKAGATFKEGHTLASMRLLHGINREDIKEVIEKALVDPLKDKHPSVPFFSAGRFFYQTTTKHPFKGVVYK